MVVTYLMAVSREPLSCDLAACVAARRRSWSTGTERETSDRRLARGWVRSNSVSLWMAIKMVVLFRLSGRRPQGTGRTTHGTHPSKTKPFCSGDTSNTLP